MYDNEEQKEFLTFEDSPVKNLKNQKKAILRQIYGASGTESVTNDLAKTQGSFGNLGLKQNLSVIKNNQLLRAGHSSIQSGLDIRTRNKSIQNT